MGGDVDDAVGLPGERGFDGAHHELVVHQRPAGEDVSDRVELRLNRLERREALHRHRQARQERSHLGAVDRPGLGEVERGDDRDRVLLDQEPLRLPVVECRHRNRAQRATGHEDERIDGLVADRLLDRPPDPVVESGRVHEGRVLEEAAA